MPILAYLGRATALGVILGLLLLVLFPDLAGISSLWPQRAVSFSASAKKAGPAVVNIYTRSYAQSGEQLKLRPQSLGSGVLMTAQGHILTNYHVIADADQITVALQDGRLFAATKVGVDKLTDLAVLHVESKQPLPVIPQDFDLVPEVGDVVLAIGNPYNVGQTITQGIISATGRHGMSSLGPEGNGRQDLLQTDAAINEGNSGGALVNSNGYLVGINTAAYQSNKNNGESYGISFAVPFRLAQKIMQEILTKGRVIRGYLGITSIEMNPVTARILNLKTTQGLVIENVDPAGPAAKAGLMSGDILTELEGMPIQSVRQVMDRVVEAAPNSKIHLTRVRAGQAETVEVIIQEDSREQ